MAICDLYYAEGVNEKEKHYILKGVTEILAAHLQPQRIVLFGSKGKGENRKYSDFDFAVEGGKPLGKKQREINQNTPESG